VARRPASEEKQLGFDLLTRDPLDAAVHTLGRPILLPIDTIEEDPSQPRLEFDSESLQELAETIARVGVKQPVSVRRKPNELERWILNFGARRLRASKLAGKLEIPAFIDESFDSYDQMIENEQREALKPLEVALFVERRLTAGDSQAEIARRLGKSKSYVTFATGMIDAPDWLMELYRSGRCKGMQELYSLRRLHEEDPAPIELLCAEAGPVTRERVESLKTTLAVHAPASTEGESCSTPAVPVQESAAVLRTADAEPLDRLVSRSQRRSTMVVVVVEHEGKAAELVVDDAPPSEGAVFIRASGGAARQCVPASGLALKGVVRR
jgi:ParB family chromosome partitioning protein